MTQAEKKTTPKKTTSHQAAAKSKKKVQRGLSAKTSVPAGCILEWID